MSDDGQCITLLKHLGLLERLDQALKNSDTGAVCLMNFDHPTHWLRVMLMTTHVDASENGYLIFAVPRSVTTRESFVQQTNDLVKILYDDTRAV